MSAETGIPIEYDPLQLPCGYDRADGLDGRLGTESVAEQIQAESSGGDGVANLPIEELPDSPVMENAEQNTITHKFRMTFAEATTRQMTLSRGIIRTDSNSNLAKMLSCTVQHEAPGKAILTTVEELMNGDTPPDRFEIIPVELGLNIIKHPRYLWAFLGSGYSSVEERQNQMVITLLQQYFDNTNYAFRNAIAAMLEDSIGSAAGVGTQPPNPPTPNPTTGVYEWAASAKVSGTDEAKRAALEIITKWWRGEETPSVVGWRIVWTEYFWFPQALNPGGYIEDPVTEANPALPEFFWSREFPPVTTGGLTIFDDMPFMNPQSYSANGNIDGTVSISWRREADQLTRERTWWAFQHSWCGSPVGNWDEQIYTRLPRPTLAQHFLPYGPDLTYEEPTY